MAAGSRSATAHDADGGAPAPSVRVRRVLTTRAGGRSAPPYDTFNLGDHVGDDPYAVAANRRRLGDGIGLGPERVAWMNQVHGTDVAVVTIRGAVPRGGDAR